MPLQFILGSSGAGKSYFLYQDIIKQSIRHPDSRFFIIVPEQFTMETQKELVGLQPDRVIMNIDILSFLRLAYAVFEETGNTGRPVLEDTGKMMLLRKVVEQKRDELSTLGRSVKKPGFLEELKSFLSEMLQYGIGEEELGKMSELAMKRPLLSGKLKDVLTIYRGFRELLQEKYMTAEEILDILAGVIADSELIRDSIVCLDGFTGFTPLQYKVISRLLTLSRRVYVTVTLDPREDMGRKPEPYALFRLSLATIERLTGLADENHVEVLEPVWMSKKEIPPRFRESRALAALERELFRPGAGNGQRADGDICIHSMRDCGEEVRFAVREILRLVREEGFRYRDTAVVTGDMSLYGEIIEREFEAAGIPVFLDQKKDILSNPLVELIRSVLRLSERDFDYTGVFRYLRCGLSGVDREDTDQLENYVLAMGIRGRKQWGKPFTRVFRKQPEIDLERINRVREQFMEKVGELAGALGKKPLTIREATAALYHFIVQEGIYDKLVRCQEAFERNGRRLLAKEYQQIYGIVVDVFDRLVELLGEETVTAGEYTALLEAGFTEARVGLIPPGVDEVMAGDIERSRLKDIRALFFLGVNEGVIPKKYKDGGVISDMERRLFEENGITLAPTGRERNFTEQFYLYLNLTKPSRYLCLTYARSGEDGKAKLPSYLIRVITRLFPDIRIAEEEGEEAFSLLGADRGRRFLLEGLRDYAEKEPSVLWKELFSAYLRDEAFRKRLPVLADGIFYDGRRQELSREAARLLYGSELHNSVTRLECYAGCPFAHFAAYGLMLEPRKEYEVSLPDIGNLFHRALERFSRKMAEQGRSWREIGDEERDRLAEEAVREEAQDYGNTVFFDTKRSEYMISRIIRMTRRTVWALCRQLQEGEFEPVGYEIRFSPFDNLESAALPLNGEETMRLMGRIDRLDLCEDEENVYIKVIDYKSGEASFDLGELYYGLQLQLVVYLSAAMELERKRRPQKRIIPAGIFYYPIDDPVVERPEGAFSEEEIESRILERLKMSGLSNQDKKILSLLDRAFMKEKSVKSKIIPVELTAKGEPGARSQVTDEKGFEGMMQFARERLLQDGREMMAGNAKALPYRMGKRTACDYCKYGSVCGFDRRLPGSHYRDLAPVRKEKIWEELKNGRDGMDQGTKKGH